ncbi:MAG: [FeFe] hydrogenase, group A, partial [Psychromonas sp.]
FCYHEDLPVDANCRACLVEDASTKQVSTSCTLPVSSGLTLLSEQSSRVKRLRKINMELLLAGHQEHCPRCCAQLDCATAEQMRKYGVSGERFKRDGQAVSALHQLGNAVEFDPQICIACNKCVEACEEMGIGYLALSGKGYKTRIDYIKDAQIACIYCGQCTAHCPVAAIREQSHLSDVEKVLKDKTKVVIVQTAPAVRASIGEEFNMPHGENLMAKLSTAYRLLGFDKVFDVNMGADITTIVEAQELVDRIRNNGILPMFTSCCPGWVKYVEFYHPELIENLTTSRSPQIHSGLAYKSWWAEKNGLEAKDIVVVSTMPCTAKKDEAANQSLNLDGLKGVDYVLTTRELVSLIKKNNIDLANLPASEIDKYAEHSGAAAIYGASGGVMESALRSAHDLITGGDLQQIEFTAVRGMQGIKKAQIRIEDLTLKVAVVSTMQSVQTILKELQEDPHAYDYIEVMSCSGGCVGGGGQPIPSTKALIKARAKDLYSLDSQKKVRKAHQNPVVLEYFNYLKGLPCNQRRQLLHRAYNKSNKNE